MLNNSKRFHCVSLPSKRQTPNRSKSRSPQECRQRCKKTDNFFRTCLQGRIQDFGQKGAQRSFDPRGSLSPKFAQNRDFPLKLPEIVKATVPGPRDLLDPPVVCLCDLFGTKEQRIKVIAFISFQFRWIWM